MADLFLFNGTVVDTAGRTGDYPTCLAVAGGKVEAVGGGAEQQARWRADAKASVDLQGRIVVPGLVNTHAHCADSLFRGLVEDLPLEPWLQQLWRAEGAILTPRTVRLGAGIGIAELLLGGVTTVADMFWHPFETAAAAMELGIRLVGGPVFIDGPGFDGLDLDGRIAQAEAFAREFAGSRTVHAAVMPHGTYTNAPPVFEAALAVARGHGLRLFTHAAETQAEQQTVRERYGRSVVEHLSHLGALGDDVVLAHCVHLSPAELDLLAESGTHVAHNPVSNLKLGAGIADVPAMAARGINVALGTDGPVSGNDMDLWLAMRLAALLPRGTRQDPACTTARQAFAMATEGGARALGLHGRIGRLAPGFDADLVVLDTARAHAQPLFDPVNHLAWSAGRADVRDVYVAGEQVVAGGELVRARLAPLLEELARLQPAIQASIHQP